MIHITKIIIQYMELVKTKEITLSFERKVEKNIKNMTLATA